MSLMDVTLEVPEQNPSVEVTRTDAGYHVREARLIGWRAQVARAVMAIICVGLMAAAGLLWTLGDAGFPADPALSKTALTIAICIAVAVLFSKGAFSLRRDELQVDLKGRMLHFAPRAGLGVLQSRKTLRFEEITRIDLAETGLMGELRSAITRLDYASITLSAHGDRAIKIIGGDMTELEPLLSRLRSDTGVA